MRHPGTRSLFRSLGLCVATLVVVVAADPAIAADGDAEGRTFGGLRFGAGLSLTVDTGDRSRVESAEIVDGIVRTTEERNVIPRLLLETHYFFPSTERAFLGIKNPGTWAWGPFVGVQSSKDDVIDAFAMGIMVGFRREGKDVPTRAADLKDAKNKRKAAVRSAGSSAKTAPEVIDAKALVEAAQIKLADAAKDGGASSFNFGIGAIVDPRVRVLGDGIEENKPLPAGETAIRYKTTSQWGVVFLFSFSF